MKQREILSTVQAHADELREYGVRHLELFGSYASGQAHEASDVDFLVEFDDGRGRGGFDDYMQTLHLLENILGKDVDLVKKHLVKDQYKDTILGGSRVKAKL
jgi:predicted nucleotidyltransferase